MDSIDHVIGSNHATLTAFSDGANVLFRSRSKVDYRLLCVGCERVRQIIYKDLGPQVILSLRSRLASHPPSNSIVGFPEFHGHSKEFKMESVRRFYEEGVTFAMVARELGISQKLIYNWRVAFKTDGHEGFPGSGHQTSEAAELKALKDELRRVKMERDILKKGAACLCQGVSERYAFIDDHHSI